MTDKTKTRKEGAELAMYEVVEQVAEIDENSEHGNEEFGSTDTKGATA